MNTLLPFRRATRWLAAAGIALACLGGAPASALTIIGNPDLDPEFAPPVVDPDSAGEGLTPVTPGKPPLAGGKKPLGERGFTFTKIGKQASCDAVVYRLKIELKGSAELFAHPTSIERLAELRFDLKDQLPAGLRITNVVAAGDLTAGGGGAVSSALSSTGGPDDTLTVSDFRISATDIDGFGGPDVRVAGFQITAAIDHSAFPAPALVDNQAFLTVTRPGGAPRTIPSHDPALPDDADPLTGEPTRIAIDLTGCDRPPPPPPPPGDDPVEACFRVETGKVDCTPGGGAFIYHMDVGADMAGNVIQLRATTPGVSVAPVSQMVPPGGGTLSWTITGASPGDVVHLIVVGVETYAGPAEGVGICCTQTVDLIIPADLDCPDRDREPDIRVEKKADATRCTFGESCDFTITVSNAGDAPYNGKIVLEEVTTPSGAALVSGPNPPWTCVPGTTPMMCEHPDTTLNPGETIELKLGFSPTLEAAKLGSMRNCAEYDYTASGKEPFGDLTNDRACATVTICVPGRDNDCTPQKEPVIDLGLRKIAQPGTCSADGVCRFRITVGNTGSTTYTGPLTVVDEFPLHPPASVSFAPSPPWSCVAESGSRFRCEHPSITLVPGASVQLEVQAIATGYPSPLVENCAEVTAVEGDTNLVNNRSCAVAELPRPQDDRPRLTVEKTGEAECRLGEECTFRITIANEGSADFSGPMNIGDAMELEGFADLSVPITAINPPLGCAPEPASLPFMCQATVTLDAGESRTHEITVMMPAADAVAGIGNDGLEGRNCFAIVEPDAVIGREQTLLSRGDDLGRKSSRYSCHPFTVSAPQEEEPQCSPGFVMNDDGRCVCPEGTTFRNGQCAGDGSTVPMPTPRPTPPPPGAQQCTLLPGQVRTRDGRCVCPRGTSLRNGRCTQSSTPPQRDPTPPTRQCTLQPGQIRTQDGRCVCPRGSSLQRGRCVQTSAPPQRPQCRPGEVRRGEWCVTVQPERCPRGTTGRPPNCRPVTDRTPGFNVPGLNVPGLRQPPRQRQPEIRRVPDRVPGIRQGGGQNRLN